MGFDQLLPDDEREPWQQIRTTLWQLSSIAREFEIAVNLADFSDAQIAAVPPMDREIERMKAMRPFFDWKYLAARHGAILLYNVFRTRDKIHEIVPELPTINAHQDTEARKAAANMIKKHFPNWAGVRLSVGHAAEMTASLEELLDHAVVGEPGNAAVFYNAGNIDGRRYEATVEGQHVGYNLTHDSAQVLNRIVELIQATFQPVADHTTAIYQEMRRTGRWPPKKEPLPDQG